MKRLAFALSLLATSAMAAPKFPIALWWPSPLVNDVPPFPNEATAMAVSGFNIIYGFSGYPMGGTSPWPETFGVDKGELALAKSLGLYIIAGPRVPYADNTAPNSVASVVALANSVGAQSTILGYAPEDEEPIGTNCAAQPGKPITFAMVPGVVAQFAAWDPTRQTYLNTTAWMVGGATFPCFPVAVAAVQAVAVASMDAFSVARVIHNPYAPPSDFLTVPNDTLWMQDIGVQGLRMIARPGQPVWTYVEGGGDNLVSGNLNTFPAGMATGSNVLVNDYFRPGGSSQSTQFTAAWIGLTVSGSGIPTGTVVSAIDDANHLELSNPVSTTACVPGEIPVALVAGSTSITLVGGCADLTAGRYAFQPIIGTGIPAGTVLIHPTDATHGKMSKAATITGQVKAITPGQTQMVTVSGGARLWGGGTGDCVVARNLCVVQGNAYRATPAQVNAEVWMSLIAGAQGIEYFCGDATSYAFCLKDAATQANVAWINKTVAEYADILNSPTAGACSTETLVDHTGTMTFAPTCSSGPLTVSSPNLPALAMVKTYSGRTYLFAQIGRRTPGGATIGLALKGAASLAGNNAMVIYDSNSRYDPAHSILGQSLPLDASGAFQDTFGANGDDYQIKIYQIQTATSPPPPIGKRNTQ